MTTRRRESGGIPARLLGALAPAALACLAAGFWQGRLVAGRAAGEIGYFNGDLYAAYVPVYHHAYRSSELLPWWNPHQLAGTPFLANTNGVLYPPNLLAAVLPLGEAMGVLGALHLAIAGIGAYLCARAMRCSTIASLLAGVTFMLCSEVVGARVHPSHLAGHAWVPLVGLAAGRLVQAPSWRRAAVLGAAMAMQLLTGSSQMALYTGYAMLVGGAAHLALAGREARRPAAVARVLVAAGLALIVALALAAVQIVPTLELLPHAGRQALPTDLLQAGVPGRHLASSFLACPIPPLLALYGICDRRQRAVAWPIAVVAAFALLGGANTWLFREGLVHLPLVSRFRNPARMLTVAHLGLALLAALGLDRLRQGLAARLGRSGAGLAAAVAAAAVVAIAAQRIAAPLVGMMMPQDNPPEVFASPEFARFLRARAPADRVLIVEDRYPLVAKAGTLFGLRVVADYEPLAPAAYARFLSSFATPNRPRRNEWRSLVAEPLSPRWRPLDLLATRHVIVARDVPDGPAESPRLRRVYRDDAVEIFENSWALPRAHLVEQARIVDRASALSELAAPAFDARTTALVEADLGVPRDGRGPAAGRVLSIDDPSPEEVVVRAQSARRAVLVLADLHWPGWRATVDGEPTPIVRSNGLFRAVGVDAGTHEIRFRYEPASIVAGAAISAGALAALAVAATASLARAARRRRAAAAQPAGGGAAAP